MSAKGLHLRNVLKVLKLHKCTALLSVNDHSTSTSTGGAAAAGPSKDLIYGSAQMAAPVPAPVPMAVDVAIFGRTALGAGHSPQAKVPQA